MLSKDEMSAPEFINMYFTLLLGVECTFQLLPLADLLFKSDVGHFIF